MSNEREDETRNEKTDETVQSPSEKLEKNPPLGSLTPGVENLESVEIKKEINPNTE